MNSSIYARSFPALTGDVVMQGHTNYCAEQGHATHKNDGGVSPFCPRCGATVRIEQTVTDAQSPTVRKERIAADTQSPTWREIMARNDERAESYYNQFTDEYVAELTAGIDQHA